MMELFRWAGIIAIAFGGVAYAAADGAAIAERCNDCHGPGGRSEHSDVPSIGGFSEFGIMDLLESFRTEARQSRQYALPDGSETNMTEISQALSEDEIEAVAVYYSEQEWRPHEQPFDAELARRGAQIHDIKCQKCHSDGGSVAEDDLAIMAGQWREYLEMEFRDFDAGTRRMADKMKEKYDTLSADEKKAILELYVSAGAY